MLTAFEYVPSCSRRGRE